VNSLTLDVLYFPDLLSISEAQGATECLVEGVFVCMGDEGWPPQH
jgi:hypothetical protein